MKTKKEIQEALIKRYLYNKKMSKLMPISCAVGLIYVILWYLCHDITYTNVWYLIAKYLFIAMGIGMCLTSCIMIAFAERDITKTQQQRLGSKIQSNRNKLDRLRDSLLPSHPLEDATEEEIDTAKKIKKLEQKILKLEAELEMVTPKW